SLVQACLARHLPPAGLVRGTRLLTAKDVHEILGVPVAYVYELMRRGMLACTAIGKYRRVAPRDLDAFLNKNRLQPREDAEYSPRGARRTRRDKQQSAGNPGVPQRPKGAGLHRRPAGAPPTPSVEVEDAGPEADDA